MIIWSNVNVSPITTLLTGFTRSSSLFFRLTNDLYVTDCENSRMQVFLANQTHGTTINVQDVNGTILQLSCPAVVTMDDHGYLFILDLVNN
jgi:hypothetical protein